MQDGIHPDYHAVVFHDIGADFKFLSKSTMKSKETIKWEDGNTYPLITVDISAASHPFFTGKMKLLDAAGRVEKFQKKYKWAKKEESTEAAQ
ncbi:50S ribosomal protein L31 type B [Caulifigura coniformis]|uniref:Large ribosomal subunit protein bL31B n=1 Tax=Caulifigura coniformis TaxID=2527983 RepID=A0A517SGY0_9PLAN|nr:type B 50S ribosomal protein L31 [Caulifigura coniformis]QDT55357.1 50S ribosomal protein L31 type B [Caulifigura coniformis]